MPWSRPRASPLSAPLLSANAHPSTLANFGEEGRWLDLHQTGNAREHYTYWYMTEMYHAEPRRPAIAGEPYYSGTSQQPRYAVRSGQGRQHARRRI